MLDTGKRKRGGGQVDDMLAGIQPHTRGGASSLTLLLALPLSPRFSKKEGTDRWEHNCCWKPPTACQVTYRHCQRGVAARTKACRSYVCSHPNRPRNSTGILICLPGGPSVRLRHIGQEARRGRGASREGAADGKGMENPEKGMALPENRPPVSMSGKAAAVSGKSPAIWRGAKPGLRARPRAPSLRPETISCPARGVTRPSHRGAAPLGAPLPRPKTYGGRREDVVEKVGHIGGHLCRRHWSASYKWGGGGGGCGRRRARRRPPHPPASTRIHPADAVAVRAGALCRAARRGHSTAREGKRGHRRVEGGRGGLERG